MIGGQVPNDNGLLTAKEESEKAKQTQDETRHRSDYSRPNKAAHTVRTRFWRTTGQSFLVGRPTP
jgi:hypothetical protein